MCNRSESGDLKRTGGEIEPRSNRVSLDVGGCCRPRAGPSGWDDKRGAVSDDGDGSLVEVWIKRPTK